MTSLTWSQVSGMIGVEVTVHLMSGHSFTGRVVNCDNIEIAPLECDKSVLLLEAAKIIGVQYPLESEG